MIAEQLIEDFPLVELATPALVAVRLLGERRLPGLVVVDDHRYPVAILGGHDVLRFVIPRYIIEDPQLAAVIDEEMADRLVGELDGKTVGDILPDPAREVFALKPEDTVLEVASMMASKHTQIIAIIDDGAFRGVVTASRLFALALPPEAGAAAGDR